MKTAVTIAAMPLLLLTALATPLAHAQDSHEHHAPATAASQQTPAQQYATDAPLRKGMAQIRTTVDALGHYERGHMGAEQADNSSSGMAASVTANLMVVSWRMGASLGRARLSDPGHGKRPTRRCR